MDTIKVKIDTEGQIVVTRSASAQQHCAGIARAIAALADALSVLAGPLPFPGFAESSRRELFALLGSLAREQAALMTELDRDPPVAENSDNGRKTFYPPLKPSAPRENAASKDMAVKASNAVVESVRREPILGH